MFDFMTVIPILGPVLAVIVPFLIVISVVIFIHEYGHYIVGRWCGIHAETFSLGFGPVVKSWVDKRGTRWQISVLPLGGFVKFLGDANSAGTGANRDHIARIPGHLRGKSLYEATLWKRAATVAAGPLANMVLSVVIFAGLAMATGIPTDRPIVGDVQTIPGVVNRLKPGDRILEVNGIRIDTREDFDAFLTREAPEKTLYLIERDGQTTTVEGPFPWLPIVAGVNPVTPAANAGLRTGDLILSVNGVSVRSFPHLQTLIQDADFAEVPIVVQRGEEALNLKITPREMPYEKEDGTFATRTMIGIGGSVAIAPQIESVDPARATYYGAMSVVSIIDGWRRTLRDLVTGDLALENLQGPVGIARASGDTASQGLTDFIFLIGFISTAIGLMNLLPIPILDGGHLVIYAYQAVFRREPPEKALQVAMGIGLCLLLFLMVFATFNDINRL
ncbi:MAG: RIP metalloprotease RseP [Rhodobacteraceae bacterium]|nr:RIP metalloprotease RseP [Paracoccaceae bacterium]